VDIQTNEVIDATPKYFITNPIPHKLGESTETPTIDELLREWVTKEDYQDESYSKTLKEIIAYCFLADMPIHRIFCFIGEGLNGKGTFLRLIENFVGESNKCASEIEVLVNNRFESSRLYKKLICIFGEIDKGIFNKTKTLKSLSGDDLIRFEFKGKDGFDDHNYAKPLISANHLPETTDKSKGFYRRWTIVNFPNQFNEKKNVLENIPEEEYENFCLQSIELLQNLLKKGEFTNDGSIEERENKYEKFSNNINEFIKIFCDFGTEEDYIEFSDFSDRYNDYLNSQSIKKKSKIEIGRSLELRGYFKKVKRIGTDLGNITTKMCIQNLKWKQEVKDLI
jgi:putative DNA primase/helicase